MKPFNSVTSILSLLSVPIEDPTEPKVSITKLKGKQIKRYEVLSLLLYALPEAMNYPPGQERLRFSSNVAVH